MIHIIGGGLAGMSTAYHLGEQSSVIHEASDKPGGLCNTRHVDGYLFDYTGHLLHLRDRRIESLVDEWLPGAFDVIERKARIRSCGATLPFPFQANLFGLPRDTVADCVVGFAESLAVQVPDDPATSFYDWSQAVFGPGISDAFMLPYNHKLFCRDPKEMTADWVSWAVPKPNLGEVVRGALGVRNEGMGYNSTFRYPKRDGIGALPAALAGRVADRITTGSEVIAVDLDKKTLRVADGSEHDWENLVVTTPLPRFLNMVQGGGRDWKEAASVLDWSVVASLNLGVERAELGDGNHWTYFPDDDVPFYRVGFPSNFSKSVAPAGCSSMYIEFGFGREESFDREQLETLAIAALIREGILRPEDTIAVRDWIRIDPGYVIFDRARQQVLAEALPWFEERGIHLIGRYGAWTYSYMERALLDGLECAAKLQSVSQT